MVAQTDQITQVRTNREAEELFGLFELVFGPGDAALWRTFHGREPFCSREWCRIIKRDEQMVSHVCWVPRDIRIGRAVIHAGAIGYTATHPDYRGQGLAGRLMRNWTQELTEKGYHLSFLTAIPRFYEHFGYEFAFPSDDRDPPVVIDVINLPDQPTNRTVRQFREDDLPALMTLYDVENAQRTGSLVRTHEYWDWLLNGLEASDRLHRDEIWLVEDSKQHIVGYAFLRHRLEGRYEVLEAATSDDATADDLLGLAAVNARAVDAVAVELKLPLDHRIVRRALMRGASLTAPSYGLHARILNLHNLFVALQPELQRRLRRSEQREWRGTLGLRTDIGELDIAVASGGITIDARIAPLHTVEIPQWLLVKLVTGYTNVRGVAGAGRANIDPDLHPLLRALFPKGCPYMWNVDVGY